MQFDAYCATIRTHPQRVVADSIARALDGYIEQGPRRQRYGETLGVHRNTDGRLCGWIGQDKEEVYCEFKGSDSPKLACHVRALFPGHTLARADLCSDFDKDDAFNLLTAVIRQHKGVKVKAGYVHLSDDPDDGRTFFAGVRGGVVYCRLYEIGKHPDRKHLCMPHLVRLEFEVRPHYAEDKALAALLEPSHIIALAPWARKVANAAAGTDIPKVDSEHVTTKAISSLHYLARKFRSTLEPMMDNGEDIARSLRQIYEDDDLLAARWALAQSGRGLSHT
jgi:hypothetical protein